jgi:uncharacterized membrane protein
MFSVQSLSGSLLSLALGLAGASSSAVAAGSFHDVGYGIFVTGASADGSVAAGYDLGTYSFYRWTKSGGTSSIGGYWTGGVASVSADGTLISGSTKGGDGLIQAALYQAGSWKALGGIGGESDGNTSSAWNLSGNGRVMVGLGWVNGGTAHAVYSVDGAPLLDLGAIGAYDSRANAASFDGSTIVGWQSTESGPWQGTFWRDGVATLMFDGDGNPLPDANAVSADGQWIVGSATGMLGLWRYNTLTGLTDQLGDYNSMTWFQGATGISGDGSIVVGYDRDFGPPMWGTGTIWIEGQGMLNLTDYVSSRGVDLQGRTLSLPLGISDDGLTIYGVDSEYHGFVVTLAPVPEPATLTMLGLGLGGVLLAKRRRNNKQQ